MRNPHRRAGPGVRHLIDRRTLLRAGVWLLGACALPRRARAAPELSPALRRALDASPYVYISPLRSDGSESRCHGEVWFGWIDGAVVVITGSDRWKARALARGLDRARIWVGDHGRWKRWLGTNDAFRAAPGFDARAEAVRDDALLDRLLETFDRKYPEEIGAWRDRMRGGYADGSRTLIRYSALRERSSRT